MSTADPTESPSPRLREFQAEVDRLAVTGGSANAARTARVLGALVALGGVALTIVAFVQSSSAADPQDQTDFVILALVGIALVLAGGLTVVVTTITGFMRYWLVRLIFEQRASTDRIVAVDDD
ncbi:MAG: hypothetical protein OEU32_03910 [Acidimicrobiia bacterium]|nr:hypothetical protein [Acidimicrobiia bacterium]